MPGPRGEQEVVGLDQIPKPVFRFIGETFSLGDRLSEIFYGVLMVSSISGLVLILGPKQESGLLYMLVVLFVSIVLWGLLDGISYSLLRASDRAQREGLVEALQAETDPERRVLAISENLEGTFVSRLDQATRSRIVEIVDKGLPRRSERMARNRLTPDEKRVILAAFLLDFAALVILVIPYLLFDRLSLAALVSHSIAMVMFVLIGYYYAKFAHLKKWKGALIGGAIGLALIVFAEATNLVII